MNATNLLRVLGLNFILGLTLAVFAPLAAAQTVYNWDAGVTGGPNDGNGTWSPSGSNNWWTGSSNVLWPNTSSFAAQFGSGSGGTAAFAVAVDPVGVTAGGVIFQNQAYSITGSTLDLEGSTPTVTVNASGGTIASAIIGGSGLTKAGNGRLSLANAEGYSGPTIISGGSVKIATIPQVVTGTPTSAGPYTFTPASNNLLLGLPPVANTNTQGGNNSNNSVTGPVTMLTNGTISNTGVETTDMPNVYTIGSGAQLTYSLGSSPYGYNLSQLNVFSEWPDGGRSQITLSDISYSTVANPTVFITLPSSNINTATGQREYVAHLTASGGVLAYGVSQIRFDFGAQQNGWVGYAELEAVGTPSAPTSNILPAGTALTIAGTSTLDLGGAPQQVASLSDFSPGVGGSIINSNTTNTTPCVLTLSPTGGSSIFSGTFAGGGTLGTLGLAMNGAGTQVLLGSNTYTGGTTITAGTLQVGNGGNSGTIGTGRIAVNDTLIFSRSDAGLTVSAVISGSGAMYQQGSGVTTLTGANSFSGTATVSAGTLQIGNGTTGSDGSFAPANIVNNSTLKYNTAGSQLYAGPISGSGVLNKSGTGTLVLSGSNTYGGATTINGGTLRLAGPIANVTGGSQLYLNAASIVGVANGGTLTAVQDLSGNGRNTTAGVGAVTFSTTGLNGNPTLAFNGASYLNDPYAASGNTGTIFVVTKPNNLTQTGAMFGASANGANIEFRQFSTGGAAQLNLLRQNTTSLNNTTTGGGAVTTSGQVVAVTFNQSPGGSEQYYVNGSIQSNSGTNTTAFGGGATAVIGGASNNENFNGNIAAVVAYNTVLTPDQIAATSAALNNQFFGTPVSYAVLPSTTDLSISASGAGLDLSGLNQSVASLSGAAGSFVRLGGAAFGVGADNLTTTFAGSITDAGGASIGTGGALTKNGAGMLTLAGANNYSGATNIAGGTLQIGAAGVLGGGNYSGAISNSGVLAVNTSSNQTYGGVISGAGPLYQLGSGTLTLAANNSYTGGTFINGGGLVVGNGATAGSILSAGSNTISNNGVLASNRSDVVTWATAINGTGSVYQIGSGSLTLAANNGYSGATTVAAGMLLLSNSSSNNIAASSPVTVNSAGTLNVTGLAGGSIMLAGGQTLRGSGTVLGSVTVPSGATIQSGTGAAAGSGIGTLTLANDLNVALGANVAYYLGTPGTSLGSLGTAGLINVQGNLTLASSGLNLVLNNNSGAGGLGFSGTGGYYELFSYSGSLSGFNLLTTFNAPSGKTYQFFTLSNQIDLYVAINDLRWTGTASSSWNTNPATTNWSLVGLSSTAASAYQDGSNVTFSDTFPTSSGTSAVSNANVVIQAAGVQPNAITFNNNTLNYTLSNASGTTGIAGATGITLSGSGTVNLQSPNSFQGLVAINAGILNVSNSAALGSSGGVSVASGGALQMQGNIALGAPLSLNGSGFSGSPAGALNSVSGTNSYAGAVTLSGPATIDTNAGQLTLTGGINNAGNLLTIGGAGITTINTPGISGSGGLTVAVGATLNMNGSLPSTTNLAANGTVNFTAASQTLASLNDSGAGSGSVTLNNTALSLTGTSVYTGSISGGGSLTLPSGALTLSGNSSLPTVNVGAPSGSATLNVTGGSVVAQMVFNASTGTNTINLSGGVLQTPAWASGANTTVNFNGGTLQANASSTIFLGATPFGNVHINAGGATIDTQANNIGISQSLSGAGGLIKKGIGTLALAASINNYGGPTLVSAGVLQLGVGPTTVAGLVARYPFEGNTNDASGNGLNATLQNGPATFTAGHFAQALTLDGSSQYVTVPYNSALALNTFTVSTWVNFNVQPPFPNAGGGPPLFSTRNGGDNTFDIQYYQQSAGVYQLHSDIGNGAGTWLSTAANYNLSGPLSGWNMVTMEVSSTGYSYFVNGSQVATGGFTTAGTPLLMTAAETLSLGAQRAGGATFGGGGYLNGSLDEANIYSGDLTAAQVLSLYQGQAGQLPATSLVVNSGATFDLNGGNQQVTDLTGSGVVTNSAATNSTLTLVSTANGSSTYGGTITNGTGVVSLALSGFSTFSEYLTGVNTFTGSVSFAQAGSPPGYSKLILANSGALLGATVTSSNGLVFDKSVTSHAFTLGGISGSFTLGLVDNNASPKHSVALSVGANNQNTTFSGTITNGGASGQGSLTKVGSGTLTLSGGNSYFGTTFINGGELSADANSAIPGLITFGGGALQFTANNTNAPSDYSGNIFNSTGPIAIDTNGQGIVFSAPLDVSNTGGLAKLGAGTLFLETSNAYGGPTYFAGGSLNLGDPGAIPTGSILTFLGGALQYSSSNTIDYSNQIKSSTGAIAIDTNGQNVTFASVLDSSNSGGFTKIGAGTLVLNANNTYGGTTTVAGGSLQMGTALSIPANSPLNLTGGTLDVNGFSRSFSQSSSFGAGGTVTNYGSLASTISLSATSNNMTIASLLTDGAKPLAFSVSSLGGSNGYDFDFTNPNNTFSGGLSISNASARLIGSNSNSAYAGTSTITISNSGFLMIWANTGSYAGSVTVSNNFVLNTIGGFQIASESGGTLGNKAAIFADGAGGGAQTTILSGSISLASNGGVDAYGAGNPNSLFITGPISGPGALVKGIDATNGGGLVTLANTANSYLGGTVINNGPLAITADAVLGAGNTITFGLNGTLQAAGSLSSVSASRQILIPAGPATLNSQNFTFPVAANISGTGALSIAGGTSGVVALSGNNTYGGGTFIRSGELGLYSTTAIPAGGTITFAGGALQHTASNTLDYSNQIKNSTSPIAIDTNSQNVTYNGVLDASNSGGLTKVGAGTLFLAGNNAYAGVSNINGGTLNLASAGAIPAGGAITFRGGTLQYTAASIANDYSGVIVNSTSAIAIDTNGLGATFGSALAGSNRGGLTKIGPGSLTLTANNLYAGVTTVSAGTLQLGDGVTNNGNVAGNISNNSALVVANPASQVFGGVISGNGSFTKNGPGTLILGANHTYNGPTAINAGVVQLGAGLTTSFANNGTDYTVNSVGITTTPFSGNVLTLTDGGGGEARSAFFNAPMNVASPFTASFVYQAAPGATLADGAAFVLQNSPNRLAALGTSGGGLGYVGMTPSAAVQFNIFTGGGSPIGTAYATGGSLGTFAAITPVDPTLGNPIQVTLTYDGSNLLVENLLDTFSTNSYSATYSVGSLAATLGGSSAFVGFTGATGGATATQTISNFSFTATAGLGNNILPATTGLSISSGTLDLFGAHQTVGALSGAGTVTNSGGTLATLTVSGSNLSSSTFSGTINDGSSQVALAVTGSGTLVLSGTNTYTGGTTVSGNGTLILTNNEAVADGTSLAVGDPSLLALLPAAVVPAPVASAAVAPVPEPGTLALLAAATMAAGWTIRRRRKCPKA